VILIQMSDAERNAEYLVESCFSGHSSHKSYSLNAQATLNLCAESVECLRVGHEKRQCHTQDISEKAETHDATTGVSIAIAASVLGELFSVAYRKMGVF